MDNENVVYIHNVELLSHKDEQNYQVWSYMPIIPALGRQSQEDGEFKATFY
jgi:hypothetical protein